MSETGSDWVRHITDVTSGHRSIISAITPVEVTAAVVRRGRAGSILAADVAAALGQLRADVRSLFRVSRIGSSTIELAIQLAERHALRGYDAVQLAAALEVATRASSAGLTFLFVSSDAELNTAATVEGLLIEDPNRHP